MMLSSLLLCAYSPFFLSLLNHWWWRNIIQLLLIVVSAENQIFLGSVIKKGFLVLEFGCIFKYITNKIHPRCQCVALRCSDWFLWFICVLCGLSSIKNNNKVKLMWNDFFLELSNEECLFLLLFTVLVQKLWKIVYNVYRLLFPF